MVKKFRDDDHNESGYENIRKHLNFYNKILKNNLKKYDLIDIYGYFVAIVFLLSFSLGILGSLYFLHDGTNFYIGIIIFTILSSLAVLPAVSSVFVHLYKQFFSSEDVTKLVISYQSITLFISSVLSLAISSPLPIYIGLLIFGILIFVNPMVKNLQREKSVTGELTNTIKKVYTVFTIITNILNFIIQYGHLKF